LSLYPGVAGTSLLLMNLLLLLLFKLAFVENNRKSRIVITTRNHEVAGKAGKVYKLQPLSDGYSRKLFLARIFGVESKSFDRQSDDEVSDKILKKCGGIPLAIITMASLLAGKPREEWSEVYHSISFANKGNHQVENTEKIISFSYYDLPSHLRTCLLYLSMFPEDYFIEKSTLVWMWIAEGFIQERQGMSSFEIGEGYFNELVNRSMIQMVVKDLYEMLCGCQLLCFAICVDVGSLRPQHVFIYFCTVLYLI
jgi:disease resistance protein RPM1